MRQKPPTRLGLFWGLSIVLALSLLDVGLVVLAITEPVTPLAVLRVLLVIANLMVMGAFLYGLFSLNSASYALDRNAIVIRWGASAQVIPLSAVEEILRGADLGRVDRFRGLRWPGYWVGRGRMQNVGLVQLYCTTPVECQLVIKTPAGSYAISPENPDRFLQQFEAQREFEPAEEVEQVAVQPSFVDRGLFSDRWAWLPLALGGLLNLGLFVLVAARYGRLPKVLPLHFVPAGAPDRWGAPTQLFSLAALGLVTWLVNGMLGAAVYYRLRERLAAYLLWGAAAGLQILLWVAISGLVKT